MSSKGGVGKSTLAVNLAGALATRGPTALLDEDRAIRTSTKWLRRGDVPVTLVEAGQRPPADARYLVIDTEGRPALQDMLALTRGATVLIPTGVTAAELEATVELWRQLQQEGADLRRTFVVITRVPPVGTVGQQAREQLRGMGIQVATTVVRNYAAYQRANEQGTLVRDSGDQRGEVAWGDVASLALEVC